MEYHLIKWYPMGHSNGFYGAVSNSSCIYFNLYIAASITSNGQGSISTAAMCFESFLANNVKHRSLNEVITYIDNIVQEPRIFRDSYILDKDVDVITCFEHIMDCCGHGYLPTEQDMQMIWDILVQLTQTDINRLFYKNNLFAFVENSRMMEGLTTILETLDVPYLDPNHLPECIKPQMEAYWDLLREYVFYNHGYIDRIDRLAHLPRKVTFTIDTDSNFVCIDPWYKFVLENVKDKDLKISSQTIDMVDGANGLHCPIRYEETYKDYDFYNDEVIEQTRLVNPIVVIPQDCVRYSIINIMAYFLGNMINEAMINYTKDINSFSEEKKCYLSMKNEFLIKRLMLTLMKKNYAALNEIQEGKLLDTTSQTEALMIKGLSLKKTTLNEKSQKQLQNILFEEILMSPEINQKTILTKLIIMEKEIHQSLANGERQYYKPLNIKSISSYDNPMGIQGIKAAHAWNELRDSNLPAFDLSVRNGIDIVKVDINFKNIAKIQTSHPEVFARAMKLMKDVKAYNAGIASLAIPIDCEVPEWVREFIDYKTIIGDVLQNFSVPLESIGLMMTDKSNITYSNTLAI